MKHPFNRNTKAPKKSLLYNRWNNLKQLSHNPNHTNYDTYGAKGITICKEWEINFLTFLLWSTKNGYEASLVLTRIDKSKGFEPNNCVWAEHSYSTEHFKK